MLSEGEHSLVDTITELLLLLGLHRSKKNPDVLHLFGYGKELYFWSFIVSLLILGLGGGVSIYQGISHIIKPEPLGDPTINLFILSWVCPLYLKAPRLTIFIKQFNQSRGNQSWWKAIVKSKDPSSFLVLFEDCSDVAGLFIVLIFTYLNYKFKLPYLDGVASLLIGFLLVGVSLILARESRGLLMGEGISPKTKSKISTLVEKDIAFLKVIDILSTYQSPEEVVLMLRVAFEEGLDTHGINDAISRIRETVKHEFKLSRFVLVKPEPLQQVLLRKQLFNKTLI